MQRFLIAIALLSLVSGGAVSAEPSLLEQVLEAAACNGEKPCPPLRRSPRLAAGEHPPWHTIQREVSAPWCPSECAIARVWVARTPEGEFVKVVCCAKPGEFMLIAPGAGE